VRVGGGLDVLRSGSETAQAVGLRVACLPSSRRANNTCRVDSSLRKYAEVGRVYPTNPADPMKLAKASEMVSGVDTELLPFGPREAKPSLPLEDGKMFRPQSNWLKFSAIGAALVLSLWHGRSASSAVPRRDLVVRQPGGHTGLRLRRPALRQDRVASQAAHSDWPARSRHPQSGASLRQRHLCGLTIIWGLQPGAADHWTGGWLYDPKDGVTYDVTAELTTPTTISARVYRGAPLFGRTETLVRDPQLSLDGRC
jgi:uncharacterized protein (DUF2147 family)